MKSKIVIAGAGGIGTAAALILAENDSFPCDIYIGDISDKALADSLSFVKEGIGNKDVTLSTFVMPKSGLTDEMKKIFESADAILDCLPGSLAPKVAGWAKDNTMHYANLTEYVSETEQIMELSKDADTAFVLQTGLAPGFINVLACKLYDQFVDTYGVDQLDIMEMKVGALSTHARGPHQYAFTWSPIGVATEYIKDAHIVRDYKKIGVGALSGTQSLVIDGEHYEDDFTSGGAADLPEAYSGKIRDLDYKTLRYPGHYDWVKKQINHDLPSQEKIDALENLMLSEIPSVEDDVVIVFAAVEGKDKQGRLRRIEKSYKVLPSMVGNKKLRAIQTTTAAPLCEIARMMCSGKWKGTVLQSHLNTDEFLNGPFVSKVYGGF